jgi:predicted aspartyl protease
MEQEQLHTCSASNVNNEDSGVLIVDVIIDQMSCRCLIDTGASCSFISHDLYTSVSAKDQSLTATLTKIPIRMGDSSIVNSYGQVNSFISIQGKRVKENFVIMEKLAYDMIIGYDFCKKHNLIIDTKTTQLHFDTDPPSDYRQLLNKGKVHLLTLLTKYDIPAFSETIIDVKVKTASHGKFLLNSLAHLTMRYGVAVAKGVI